MRENEICVFVKKMPSILEMINDKPNKKMGTILLQLSKIGQALWIHWICKIFEWGGSRCCFPFIEPSSLLSLSYMCVSILMFVCIIFARMSCIILFQTSTMVTTSITYSVSFASAISFWWCSSASIPIHIHINEHRSFWIRPEN